MLAPHAQPGPRTLTRTLIAALLGVAAPFVLLALLRAGISAQPSHTLLDQNQSGGETSWDLVAEHVMPPLDPLALDVAIAPDGRWMVADAQGRQILVYGPDGSAQGAWVTGDPPLALAWGRWTEGDRLFVLTFGRIGLRLETWSPSGVRLRADLLQERLTGDETTRAFDLAVESDGSSLLLLNNAVVQRVGVGESGVFVRDARDHRLATRGLRIAAYSETLTALVVPEARELIVRQGANTAFMHRFTDAVPLDADRGPDGDLRVLLRTATGAAVAAFDDQGTLLATRPLTHAGLSAPVDPLFRWSISAGPRFGDERPGGDAGGVGDGDPLGYPVALTTGASRLSAFLLAPDGGTARAEYGRVPEDFALSDLPRRANLLSRSGAVAIAPAPPGAADGAAVLALDGPGARLLHLSGAGDEVARTVLPYDTIDFAHDGNRVYLSTQGGRVRRFALGVAAASPLDPWSLVCDCDLGGRLTLLDGRLHISRPAERRAVIVDASTGAAAGSIDLPGAVGLWPADLEGGPDGLLWTADLVTGQVEGWRDAAAPERGFRAGLLAGPRRLASGRVPGTGAVVAALLVDGTVELHEAASGALLSSWQPTRGDGTPYAAEDLALDAEGRVWLAEAASRVVRAYAPGRLATPTPGGPPPPTPTPSSRACRVTGDKVAGPTRLVLGESARVTLTLQADCPDTERIVGADIVLVIDRSSSMDGDPLRASKQAARVFAELLDVRFHRVGLVSYGTNARLDVPLTNDVLPVARGIDALVALGETDISAALETAADHLRSDLRRDVLPVVVLLTDGQHTGPPPDPVTVAQGLHAEKIQVYTVGLGDGVDQTTLEAIATSQDRFFFAPTPQELFPIYREILRLVVSSGTVGNLVIDDRLAPDINYLPASAAPRALESPGRLRWSRASLPTDGLTLTFDVAPQRAGRLPVSERAEATFTDNDGVPRTYLFPVPELEVVAPTATPTPVFTAHLPIAYKEHCLPSVERADIVLLIDASSSMAGEKLVEARAAARGFVGLLQLPGDQAAIIGFDDQARILASLTSDPAALQRGLDALAIGSGTRIDRALLAARDELGGPARDPRHRAVVVLLSDGGQSGAPEAVDPAAAALRAIGAELYTIALGPDADIALLSGLVSADHFFVAPTPADLQTIYTRVAGRTICR